MRPPTVAVVAAFLAAGVAGQASEHDSVTPIRAYIEPGSWRYNQLSVLPGPDFLYQAYSTSGSVTWGIADGVSHRMSLRLRTSVNALARNVHQTMGGNTYNLKVVTAYQNATTAQRVAGDQSLFFEGRALRVQLFEGTMAVQSESELQALYREARLSGFDFVQPDPGSNGGNTAVIYVSALPDYCYNDRPIDLAFLLDGSSSIYINNFTQAKDFVEAVTANFFIGEDQTRVAVSTFSSDRGQRPARYDGILPPDVPDCEGPSMFTRTSGRPICICVDIGATCVGVNGTECNGLDSGEQGPIQIGLAGHQYANLSWFYNAASSTDPNTGCSGGEPYVINDILLGSLDNNVRDDLLFAQGTSATTVQTAVSALQLPGGGTRTSLALANIRTTVMTAATGARGPSVPKVLVVMTDGLASAGFEPEAEATLLKNEGVTILAIGIGLANTSQLRQIASSPEHVFAVDVFAELPEIVGQIDTLACGACAQADWDAPVTVNLADEDFRCVALSCGVTPEDSVAIVTTLAGEVYAYTSPTQFGGPLNFSSSRTTASRTKTMAMNDADASFLILEGRRASTSVLVTFQHGSPQVAATVAGWDPVGTAVASVASGAQSALDRFTLSSPANPELAGLFRISAAGAITVAESLIGAPQQVELDIAVTSSAACRSRSVAVTVDITTPSPTSGPTRAPTAAPTPCLTAGEDCLDGGGVCEADGGGGGGLTCRCGAGLFGSRCLPQSPSITTPPLMTIAAEAAVDTPVGQIEAEFTGVGTVGFAIAGHADLRVSGVRRSTTMTNISTPLYINATTGEVFAGPEPLPASGEISVTVTAFTTLDDRVSEPAPAILTVRVTPAPTITPPVAPTPPGTSNADANADASAENDDEAGVGGGAIAAIVIILLLCIVLAMFLWLKHNNDDSREPRKTSGVENPLYSTANLGPTTTAAPSEDLYAECGDGGGVAAGGAIGGANNPMYGTTDRADRGGAVENATYAPVTPGGQAPSPEDSLYSDAITAGGEEYMDPAPQPGAQATPVDGVLYDVAGTEYMDPAPQPGGAIGGANNPMYGTADRAVAPVDDVLYDVAATPGTYDTVATINAAAPSQTNCKRAKPDSYLTIGDDEYLDGEQQPLYDQAATESTAQPVYDMAAAPVAAPRRPRLPTLSVMSGRPLPANWHEATDAEGTVYFYNSVTQESAWERPVAAGQVETNL